MNLFWELLVLGFNITWLATGVALVVLPILWIRSELGSNDMGFVWVTSAFLIVGGIALLLFFGAVFTGGVNIGGHPDGCYHIYYVPGAKTGHTEYDPIRCPEGIG